MGGGITIFAPMTKAMVLAKSLHREPGIVALFQTSFVHTNAGWSVFSLEMSNTSMNKAARFPMSDSCLLVIQSDRELL